ncbi:protein IQ-DOMAIN 32-like isoform X1 [Ananas comosus]|uniref:Protein IQ-DOMAIN 32-like isoform X1 n=1 Tax=Ananas comosus TaxID=4615 RepID=A0A6P5FC24_ANACO|nr:protein IQ-DOMAIN 32-like isoform X1 [Ananas comosus]
MGKSATNSSCFKLFTCSRGGGRSSSDEIEQPKRASSEKRRWSFHKTFSRQQQLSNTVKSETHYAYCDKEFRQSNTASFSSVEDTEKLPNSVVDGAHLTASATATAEENLSDNEAIIIQCTIRRCLAQKELQKIKNVVTLQAVIRGYLERRQAVETLRRLLSVVKIQDFVRAKILNLQVSRTPNHASFTIKKVYSNMFARQLLESMLKTKAIYRSCDPSNPNSTWQWCKRWMSITSCNSNLPPTKEIESQKEVEDENIGAKGVKENSDSASKQASSQADDSSELLPNYNSQKRASKSSSCIPHETGGKLTSLGSGKAHNPAFAAAQLKFKELSSAQSGNKSESKSVHSRGNSQTQIKELENSGSQNLGAPTAASECNTEISISSTFDSPDGSDGDGGAIVLEIKSLEENRNDGEYSHKVMTNTDMEKLLSNSDEYQQQILEENGKDLSSKRLETVDSSTNDQLNQLKDPQVCSSPQLVEKGENRHQKSQFANKDAALKSDSDGRIGTEVVLMDVKSTKRRYSGSARPDQRVHGLSVSGSKSIPSYMQATESARAKVHGSMATKSSVDEYEGDGSAKKRHSLPIEDGRRGSSPRMRRSRSQIQNDFKEKNINLRCNSVVSDRKWQS